MKPKTVGREGGITVADAPILTRPGLAQGTEVLTLDGTIPVEFLSPGDRVITRDSGLAVLRAVSVFTSPLVPYRIMQGTLGQNRPHRDLLVAAGQKVLLRDWRAKVLFGRAETLVPLARITDGEFIRPDASARHYRFFALQFDKAHVLYADGVELCSAAPVMARARIDA